MTQTYDREKMIDLVNTMAISKGDFTLASGAKATFYLDCRRLTLNPQGLVQISAGFMQLLRADMPEAVGGMAIGADPITAGIIYQAGLEGVDLSGFIVRKEPKGHGTGRQVEGPVSSGQKVVIVEDVVTTGGSSVKAIQAAREFGLEVQKVIAIVDRQAGGREAFEEIGVAFESLLTLDDLDVG